MILIFKFKKYVCWKSVLLQERYGSWGVVLALNGHISDQLIYREKNSEGLSHDQVITGRGNALILATACHERLTTPQSLSATVCFIEKFLELPSKQ